MSELNVLKLDTKIMQQRINRLEISISKVRYGHHPQPRDHIKKLIAHNRRTDTSHTSMHHEKERSSHSIKRPSTAPPAAPHSPRHLLQTSHKSPTRTERDDAQELATPVMRLLIHTPPTAIIDIANRNILSQHTTLIERGPSTRS